LRAIPATTIPIDFYKSVHAPRHAMSNTMSA
jgi:hypothetical protein